MRRLITAVVALAVTLGTVPVVASTPVADEDARIPTSSHIATDETSVESFDGHEIPIRVYEAAGEGSAPTLLWGHGWGGSYADSSGDGTYFAERGYNVVAMDFRGHGQAREDSQARVHSVDHEIQDVSHVIDWIAEQGLAELDEAGDPVLGALGGSYGGGYQLLTAAHDDRLDAIAPEITWNSLPQSLAPNGAIKSTWVDALYAAGTAQGSLAPFIHQGYAWGTAMNEFPDGELPGEPDVEGRFLASSPTSYEGAIDVPTLLIQGMPDVLFPLNEAVANAQEIQDAGSPEVKVVTHLGGHVLNTDGTLGFDEVAVGIQEADRGEPCGDDRELVHRWYDDHLKDGADDGIPPAKVALADGTCLEGAHVAAALLGEAPRPAVGLDDVVISQGAPVASGYAQADEDLRVPSPIQRTALAPETPRTLTGIPSLSGDITIAGSEAIVYVSLVLDDGDSQEVVHDQTVPLREEGPVQGEPFDLDLGGVGVAVDAGEELLVEFSTAHPMYGDNGNRAPGALVLENLSLELPEVPPGPG